MPEEFVHEPSAGGESAAAASPDSSGFPETAAAPAAPGPEFRAALEAIIYAAEEPVSVAQLASAVHGEKDAVRRALRELIAAYASDERGIEIREVAGGFKFYTKPQHHDAVRRFIKSLQPPLRLSMPALETLAVIAYKQPVTLPEIQEIRGVQAAGVIKTLLERGMITTAGRKEALGRPILYRTTKDFLMRFGLAGVEDLPSLKEFEALARAALGEDGILPEEEPEAPPATAGQEPAAGDA
jgi:segregation and condensation protein B